MDPVENPEICVNGIKKSKNSVQIGALKTSVDKVATPKPGKNQTKSSSGEIPINGNETEKVKSTLNFQLKSDTSKPNPVSKTGSGNSSVGKGSSSDNLDKTNSNEDNKSTKEDISDKKTQGKGNRLSNFAAPTKSSIAKVAGKTPEGKKSGTGLEKSVQDSTKDASGPEKRSSSPKKKGLGDIDEKISSIDEGKQKPKTSEKSELVKEKSGSGDQGKTKLYVSEKSEFEKHKQNPKSSSDKTKKQDSKPKETEKSPENNTSKVGNKQFTKSSKKRVIDSEKSTIEEEELCYLKFDLCEDYNMAQAQIDPEAVPKDGTEYIHVTDNKLKYINTKYTKVQAKMYDYKCDVKLKVADQNFKAHRDVLSEASDYFSAMFRHDMKEKEQDVIELKEISPKGFAAILDYFYHGHVTIDPDNIEDVIEAARFFHNDWLLEICCDFLVRHLSLENYTAVLQLTDKYWLGDLRWDIFVFLGQNLPDLVQQEKFYQNLPMELILQFLMENVYVEASEYFILQLILKWVQEDPDKRQEHLLSLLRQIRFPVMEAEELESLPDEVMTIPEMKQLVGDAQNYVYNFMGQCLRTGDMYQPRGARSVLTVLSFFDEGNVVAYRDPEKEGLFVEQLGPTGLETADYHAMSQTSIGNFLYAAGGYDDNYSSIARVFRYDPKYREWTEVSPMNQPRVSFAICSSDTKLYVFGGVNHSHSQDGGEEEDILADVEVFDPQENNWTALPALPVKCFDQAAALWDNCVFVTGGISSDPNDTVPLDNTWCLKLDGNGGWMPEQSMTQQCQENSMSALNSEWIPKQCMMKQRQGHSMSALNGKLYVVGGYTCFGDTMTFRDCIENEVFDTETGQWTQLAPTPDKFGHLFRHVGVINNKIFLLGGSTPTAMLYVYDTDTDTWEEKEAIGPNVQKLAILSVAYPHS